jgi:hypothetical protein
MPQLNGCRLTVRFSGTPPGHYELTTRDKCENSTNFRHVDAAVCSELFGVPLSKNYCTSILKVVVRLSLTDLDNIDFDLNS